MLEFVSSSNQSARRKFQEEKTPVATSEKAAYSFAHQLVEVSFAVNQPAHARRHEFAIRTRCYIFNYVKFICQIFFGLCCYLLAEFLRRNIKCRLEQTSTTLLRRPYSLLLICKRRLSRTLARTCWCALAMADSPSDTNTIRDKRRRTTTSTVSAARLPFTSAPLQPIKKLSVPL
jgi:hypothetical protein